MKKLFYFATAILALAACSKSEILNPNNTPISFSPKPMATKALILPNDNQTDTTAFPTSEEFAVFAFADTLSGNGPDYVNPLMNDVPISFHATTNGGDWKATTGTYVWPAKGTVDFYAYYPSTLNATFNSSADFKHIELTGIQLGTQIGYQTDPMTASTMAQLSTARPKVGLIFKHITSQIAVKAYDATQTANLQGKISIEKVVFKNMKTSGDYSEGTSTGKGSWSNINDKTDFTSFQGKEVLELNESFLSGDDFSASIDNSAAFVIVPEYVINDATDGQAIEVTYSVAPYTINGFDYPATPSTTEIIPLYNRVNNNEFVNGKRYVFHLGLSLDGANHEIMFSPQVVGWDTVDINGITIDVANGGLL